MSLLTRHPASSTTVCLCIFLCIIVFVDCFEEASARVYVVKSQKKPVSKKCRVHVNTHLHVVMDRICMLCHEMFSHENPNFRADCSSNCFKSEHFRKCLNVFGPMEAPKIINEMDKYE
ncbi:unnamed protein product [Bursaphelenchus xylophilus]|uniref:(pine wood nematode) hypothetical protein n=1 Tax=Bursaphelenchus xylophilus TaxID=6326 RepID=A0A1I7S9F8_BURXY|nr:unnamed protein product [Bursaphelenchus xylophilus]CAG9111070.1 unnamed protein product [Bursaphelenchus xylophilus]